jgi:hypothetical protein
LRGVEIKKLGIALASLLIAALLSVSVGCGGEQTKATLTPTPTLPPKIGDEVLSNSVRAKVVSIKEVGTIADWYEKKIAGDNFTFLVIRILLENLAETSKQLTFAGNNSIVKDVQGQEYLLQDIGCILGDPDLFLLGSRVLKRNEVRPTDESWILTADFVENIWMLEMTANSDAEILLVYKVATDSSGFRLTLLDFPTLRLEE